MIKGVIFDMDGVLVETEPLYFEIEDRLFRENNIIMTEEEHHKYVGTPLSKMWGELKAKHNLKKEIDELVLENMRRVYEFMENLEGIRPIAGIEELLEVIEKRGLKKGVASSSPKRLIEILLTKAGIKNRFEIITSGEEVVNGKSSPDIFLLAAVRLGLNASECIVVEDSSHGVRGAKSAGMKCIGYKNLNSGNQNLKDADYIVDKIETIITKGIF